MIYAMSDIHGEYDRYIALLEKIGFCDDDTLYVIGDVVDRGPDSVRLLQDMAARPNVYLIRGNHEAMLCFLCDRLGDDLLQTPQDPNLREALDLWKADGGDITLRQLAALPPEERYDLLDYMDDTPLYDLVEAGGNAFLLVHAGLGNFSPDKPLEAYTYSELCCKRPDYDRQYFPAQNLYIVCGHTPTQLVTGKAEIYQSHNNILIDCGAVFGGRLACICLDTFETYYA